MEKSSFPDSTGLVVFLKAFFSKNGVAIEKGEKGRGRRVLSPPL